MAGMHLLGGHGWQYSQFSTVEDRERRCQSVLVDLVQGRISALDSASDSRNVHFRMFSGMHPAGMEYLAGNYRGTQIGVLASYDVQFDGRQGTSYALVDTYMRSLADRIRAEAERMPREMYPSPGMKLLATVGAACELMIRFMTIHPYADGNGHIGRYVIWAFLHHFNIHAKRWPLNDRPGPNYFDHIRSYRSGQRKPLIQFVLSHMV